MAADADERTPLLKIKSGAGAVKRVGRGLWSPANRILFAGFLVSLTLGLTQVPCAQVHPSLLTHVVLWHSHEDVYHSNVN